MGQLQQWLDKNTNVPFEKTAKMIDVGHLMLVGVSVGAEALGPWAGLAEIVGPVAGAAVLWYELFYAAHAESMAQVKRERFVSGYAIGVICGAWGKPRVFVMQKFWTQSASYYGPSDYQDLAAAGLNAYHQGLRLGYKEGSEQSAAQRDQFLNKLFVAWAHRNQSRDRGIIDSSGGADSILGLAGTFISVAIY